LPLYSTKLKGGLKLLRNSDKKRIYQEEAYRREVREQLAETNPPKTKESAKIWTFINSSFFLWFLSSVLIGIISFSYAKWDKQRELEREQRERAALVERENIQIARKLDAEISSRLNYFALSQNIYLYATMDVPVEVEVENGSAEKSEVMSEKGPEEKSEYVIEKSEYVIDGPLSEEGIMSLDDPNAIGYKVSVYPEYATRNLRSLLLELMEVVPPQEKNEIDLAYKQSIESQYIFIEAMITIKELKKNGRRGYVNKDEINLAPLETFCKFFNLKRWGEPIPISVERIREIPVYVTPTAQSNNSLNPTPR
jgi:hypothetical protein